MFSSSVVLMILMPDASSSWQAFAVFSWNRTKWFQYEACTES